MHSDNIELSFAVACSGREFLRQRLTLSLALADFPFKFEILYAEATGLDIGGLRNSLFRQARGSYVYFLDDDCEWPSNFDLNQLRHCLDSGRAFTGPYLHGRQSRFFGRAYNFMTNAWLRRHAQSGQPMPLAGNCLIPKTPRLIAPYSEPCTFGGEEQDLRARLLKAGIGLQYSETLAVEHNAQHSSRSFFGRAWLHGRSPQSGVHSSILEITRSMPSFNPILLGTFAAYHLTQILSRRWARP